MENDSQILIRVPKNFRNELKNYARSQGHTMSSIIRDRMSKEMIPDIATAIRFLPSGASPAHILFVDSGVYKNFERDPDTINLYNNLRGVAIMPPRIGRSARLVIQRLAVLGVVFLDEDEARHYMGGEGHYWAAQHYKHSRSLGFNIPYPTIWERICWWFHKPATPLYDQYRRLRAA